MDRVLLLAARGNSEQAANTVQFLSDQAAGLEVKISALQLQIADINAQNGSVLAGGGMIVGGSGGSYDVQIAALQRDNQLLIQQRNLAQTRDQRSPLAAAAELRGSETRRVGKECVRT